MTCILASTQVRGLTIDKQRGNVLKIDRHKYVKIAYHGFRQLSREQRLSTYANSDVRAPHAALPCAGPLLCNTPAAFQETGMSSTMPQLTMI